MAKHNASNPNQSIPTRNNTPLDLAEAKNFGRCSAPSRHKPTCISPPTTSDESDSSKSQSHEKTRLPPVQSSGNTSDPNSSHPENKPESSASGGKQAMSVPSTPSTMKANLGVVDLSIEQSGTNGGDRMAVTASNSSIDVPANGSAGADRCHLNSSCGYPTVSKKESLYPAKPAEFPSWTIRRIPRAQVRSKKGPSKDDYFYSPILGIRFRSKLDVRRFLKCCLSTNGKEEAAFEKFCAMYKDVKRMPKNSARKMPDKAPSLKYKVLEFVPPSNAILEKNKGEDECEKKAGVEDAAQNLRAIANTYSKPFIKKGQQVYACWSGPDGLGQVWYPGRVWDIKEYPGSEYGPQRKFDVVFDDGDTESNLDEIWVSDRIEYEICTQKPEEEWIGVRNICFPESNDEYAQTIGWYETCFGGINRVYSSLVEALRSHDKHIIEIKGKGIVSASDLNFPQEHYVK